MNAIANERVSVIEESDNPSHARQAFPDAKNSTEFGPQLFALSTTPPATAPEETLAIGVLSQAAHDLRRFHSATSDVERELYLGAYAWIKASDFSSPYSFVNVCESLHSSPEIIRVELLADVSLGWFGRWIGVGKRLSRLLRASFIRVFTRSREANNSKSGRSAPAFQ